MTPESNSKIQNMGCDFTFQDVHSVVDSFYRQIPQHESLRVPFASVHDWPHHIERLTHFWWTVLGGDPYLNTIYNPPLKHFYAGFNEEFLVQWLELFDQTMQSCISEKQREVWMAMARRMGQALNAKNEYLKRISP